MKSQARAGRAALLGAAMGLLAALGSIPFLPSTRGKPGLVGMNMIYSPVQYILLGLLIGGVVSMIAVDTRFSPPRVLLAGVLGALLGAVFTFGAGIAFHSLSGVLMDGKGRFETFIEPIVWDILVCGALAAAIGIATQPGSRIGRIVGAAFAGAFLSHLLHRFLLVLGLFIAIGALFNQGERIKESWRIKRDTGVQVPVPEPEFSKASLPILIGSFIAVGAGMGFCFGLVDLVGRNGWLVLRKKEGSESIPIYNRARLGSGPFAEVQVHNDPAVALVHGRIEADSTGFSIVDLGTPAGVLVNGKKVQRTRLQDGDVIRLGSTDLVFQSQPTVIAAYPVISYGPPPATLPAGVAYRLIDEAGKSTHLTLGQIGVGRESGNAIDLSFDQSISRHHAVLHVEHGRVVLEDLGSRNGSTVNGQRLSAPVELSDGDEVSFGRTKFVFRRDAAT